MYEEVIVDIINRFQCSGDCRWYLCSNIQWNCKCWICSHSYGNWIDLFDRTYSTQKQREVSQFQFVELIDSEENATTTSVQVEQKWVFAISAKLSESVFEILPNLGRIIYPQTIEFCDLKFRI